MTKLLFDNFDMLAESPGGVNKLRKMILQMAVQGKLVPQDPKDEPASVLVEKISEVKNRLIIEGKEKASKALPPVEPEEQPWVLPRNWEWCRLGDVTSYAASSKAEPRDLADNVWILELEDIEKDSSKIIKKIRYGERIPKSTKNVFFEEDVIYGKLRPYLDKVAIADEDGVCTTEMIPLNGYGFILSGYIRWFMKSSWFIEYANNSTHGMNLPRLGTEKARNANFALPPLKEQKRIVSKVDSLMSLCDELENFLYIRSKIKQAFFDSLIGHIWKQGGGGNLF